MKKTKLGIWPQALSLVLLTAVAAAGAAQSPPPSQRPPPATAEGADPGPPPTPEQISYLVGLVFGSQLHSTGVTAGSIKPESVVRGLNDGLQGKQPTATDQQHLQAYARSVHEAMLGRNEAAAKDFLARNSKLKGIVTTASGLQYKIIKAGDKSAASPRPTDTVTVDYRGKLIDGVEFDSSFARGMPATFPVNGVIRGWQEALVLMKPGADWQLFIPPALAYGPQGQGPKIPPNSLLIFEVNLKSVEAANAPARTPPAMPQRK